MKLGRRRRSKHAGFMLVELVLALAVIASLVVIGARGLRFVEERSTAARVAARQQRVLRAWEEQLRYVPYDQLPAEGVVQMEDGFLWQPYDFTAATFKQIGAYQIRANRTTINVGLANESATLVVSLVTSWTGSETTVSGSAIERIPAVQN